MITTTTDWRKGRAALAHVAGEVDAAPFQTSPWVSAWFDHARGLGLADPVVAIGTTRPDQAPEIVLPLCLYRRHGLRIVSPPDHGVSDYFQIPAVSSVAQDAGRMRAFFAALPSDLPPHDIIQISRFDGEGGISPHEIFSAGHVADLQLSAWSLSLGQHDQPPRMESKLRNMLRRAIRSMEKAGDRRVEHHWPVTDPSLLEAIWAMRGRRLASAGYKDVLDDGWLSFYARLIGSHPDELSLNATILYANDDMVAASMGLRSGRRLVTVVLAMEPGLADRSLPGLQATMESIGEAERQGIETFDLSIGDQGYKRSFGCAPRPLQTIVVPRTATGYAAWAAWRARHLVRVLRKRGRASP